MIKVHRIFLKTIITLCNTIGLKRLLEVLGVMRMLRRITGQIWILQNILNIRVICIVSLIFTIQ